MIGTSIEWCDATFNPWWGCERVSPGCAHCYADTLATRFGDGLWGARHGFRFFGDKHWQDPLRWARTLPGKLGRRPRIFCASMADVFEERDELADARVRLFDLILRTPELDWLILTKRPEFARDWLANSTARAAVARAHAFHFEDGDNAFDYALQELARPLRNVWLGVSIENARFTWRADVLREIPAAVRFISAEPLLGSLFPMYRGSRNVAPLELAGIDWVIVGGESGPGARPFHLEHAREIVNACWYQPDRQRVAVFVKQLGAKPMFTATGRDVAVRYDAADRKGGDPSEWPGDLRIREFPRSAA